MTGYSDRVNHALAFAAKHHDQQVRRGTRPPYSTQAANLAVILTRYACDEDTVVAPAERRVRPVVDERAGELLASCS